MCGPATSSAVEMNRDLVEKLELQTGLWPQGGSLVASVPVAEQVCECCMATGWQLGCGCPGSRASPKVLNPPLY